MGSESHFSNQRSVDVFDYDQRSKDSFNDSEVHDSENQDNAESNQHIFLHTIYVRINHKKHNLLSTDVFLSIRV